MSLVLKDYAPGLIEAPIYRSEYLPSTTPLPTLLAELPDVINPLVGFHGNDIAALADGELIEPLDPFFERIGIDPKSILSPGVLEAVTYQGKIWALPHHAETLVLSYDRKIFEAAGIEPNVESWDAVFQTLQRVAESPATRTGDEATLQIGRMPDDAISTLFLWYSTNVAPNWTPQPTSVLSLFGQYQDKQVFAWVPFMQSMTRVETFATIASTKERGLRILPDRLSAEDAPGNSLGPLSFLECFALRKNSPERLEAGELFLQWLITVETQLRLVEASRLDYAEHKRALVRPHIPLYRPALEAEQFKKLSALVPEYQMLVDYLSSATFAVPLGEPSADRRFVIHRGKLGEAMIPVHGDVKTLQELCKPRSEEEDKTIADAVTTADAKTGAFDEF